MRDEYQILPPLQWETFESMCRDIFAREWGDKNTKKNGRTGFPQQGVDIYGYTPDKELHGVQCKKKDLQTIKKTSEQEFRQEVKNALEFTPKLSSFTFATTTPNDPKLEKLARVITEEHKAKKLFSVHFLGWDDIRAKLSNHEDLFKRYGISTDSNKDSNSYAFELWRKYFKAGYLFHNCCRLPFRSHNIFFKSCFLSRLKSFSNESDFILSHESTPNLNKSLREAIENFKKISSDVIKTIEIEDNILDTKNDIYKYFVNVENLDPMQSWEYIEYKKIILRTLFYSLIQSANHIINIKYRISGENIPKDMIIPFIENFDEDEPVKYPRYSDIEIKNNELYNGIDSIKRNQYHRFSIDIPDCEKCIESLNKI
jgi:hypothetical protein